MNTHLKNKQISIKCHVCPNEATGIIYQPTKQLKNILTCTIHATNLFIPFKNSNCDYKILSQSRYRSPIKTSQLSCISQILPLQKNPQVFFDILMQNIIQEFNTMKKQVMSNYNFMKNLPKSQEALSFKMQGNPSYPYMLINNDQDMMMQHFLKKLKTKYDQQTRNANLNNAAKRRMQIFSSLLSSPNLQQSKMAGLKEVNSLYSSRSIQGSLQKATKLTSIQKSPQVTQRRPLVNRNYSRTQKRQKN